MTASEAKSIADNKMSVVKEANEIYTKIQDQIREYSNQGLYRTFVYIDSYSYDAVMSAVEILKEKDGFECGLSYKSVKAAIEVSWENAEEVV